MGNGDDSTRGRASAAPAPVRSLDGRGRLVAGVGRVLRFQGVHTHSTAPSVTRTRVTCSSTTHSNESLGKEEEVSPFVDSTGPLPQKGSSLR